MADERLPMTPEEFDRKVRELTRVCPWLSQTSGYRSEEHNLAVGGHPTASKHLIGMGTDFISGERGLEQAQGFARKLGFWSIIHGDPPHLHVQGLPSGPIVETTINWNEKWGKHGND